MSRGLLLIPLPGNETMAAALARSQGTLIEVVLDPEVITTRATLSSITRNALRR